MLVVLVVGDHYLHRLHARTAERDLRDEPPFVELDVQELRHESGAHPRRPIGGGTAAPKGGGYIGQGVAILVDAAR